MKKVLVLTVCGVCVLQVIGAATTIDEIKSKEIQLEDNINKQISETVSIIAQSISSKRSSLNSRAEAIKKEIQRSPQKCHVWLKKIDSIKSKMTKEFQPCEESDRLTTLKQETFIKFRNFDRDFERCRAICNSILDFNCPEEIRKLDAKLHSIQIEILFKNNNIRVHSKRCVDVRGNDISKSFESVYKSFKKCK